MGGNWCLGREGREEGGRRDGVTEGGEGGREEEEEEDLCMYIAEYKSTCLFRRRPLSVAISSLISLTARPEPGAEVCGGGRDGGMGLEGERKGGREGREGGRERREGGDEGMKEWENEGGRGGKDEGMRE